MMGSSQEYRPVGGVGRRVRHCQSVRDSAADYRPGGCSYDGRQTPTQRRNRTRRPLQACELETPLGRRAISRDDDGTSDIHLPKSRTMDVSNLQARASQYRYEAARGSLQSGRSQVGLQFLPASSYSPRIASPRVSSVSMPERSVPHVAPSNLRWSRLSTPNGPQFQTCLTLRRDTARKAWTCCAKANHRCPCCPFGLNSHKGLAQTPIDTRHYER